MDYKMSMFKALAGLGCLFLCINLAVAQTSDSEFDYNSLPNELRIDPDRGNRPVTVYAKPGSTSDSCRIDPKLCVAWPHVNATITRVAGSKIVTVRLPNLAKGEIEEVPYVHINYDYKASFTRQDGSKGELNQKGQGWMEAYQLRPKNERPIYTDLPKDDPRLPVEAELASIPTYDSPIQKGADCQETQAKKNIAQLQALTTQIKQTPNEQLNTSVELLRPLIGQCPLNPPNKKRAGNWKGKHIYDSEILPIFQKMKPNSIPKVPKEIRPGEYALATKDDLMDIDALARTIYSEMNECFKVGLQFPMAAAKVAMNRKDLAIEGKAYPHFVHNQRQDSSKPKLTKVLTAPFQFSVWNNVGASNPKDLTSLMSLCPTTNESNKNWKGSRPGPDDLYAWDMSLKIATEAVLYPDKFKNKTKEVTQLYYTSKRSQYDKRRRPNPAPKIEGRAVNSYRCMYLWEGK